MLSLHQCSGPCSVSDLCPINPNYSDVGTVSVEGLGGGGEGRSDHPRNPSHPAFIKATRYEQNRVVLPPASTLPM